MSQTTITQIPAEPTVESLKQRVDELEAFIVEWMNVTSMRLKEAIAVGADSNATAKRILDKLESAHIQHAPMTSKQVM